jgi:hypothetical protein
MQNRLLVSPDAWRNNNNLSKKIIRKSSLQSISQERKTTFYAKKMLALVA